MRSYRYYQRYEQRGGYWVAATREEWLAALLHGQTSPKPPPSWVKQQALEGRTEKAAAIIWGRHYSLDRKYAIWDQADEADFKECGYR